MRACAAFAEQVRLLKDVHALCRAGILRALDQLAQGLPEDVPVCTKLRTQVAVLHEEERRHALAKAQGGHFAQRLALFQRGHHAVT